MNITKGDNSDEWNYVFCHDIVIAYKVYLCWKPSWPCSTNEDRAIAPIVVSSPRQRIAKPGPIWCWHWQKRLRHNLGPKTRPWFHLSLRFPISSHSLNNEWLHARLIWKTFFDKFFPRKAIGNELGDIPYHQDIDRSSGTHFDIASRQH